MSDGSTLLFPALFIAASLHVLEEYLFPGGFPDFMRTAAPAFAKGINRPFAIIINGLFLIACAVGIRQGPRLVWYGVALAVLVLLNGLTHLTAAVRFRRYAPGMVTGTLLYLPIAGLIFWQLASDGQLYGRNLLLGILVGILAMILPLVWLAAARLLQNKE
jgi:hypothetical protein